MGRLPADHNHPNGISSADSTQPLHALGNWRRIATGCDRLTRNYLAGLALIAVTATLADFPAPSRAWYSAFRSGLKRAATKAGMQPLRQRTGLQANAGERQVQASEEGG